LIVKKKLQKAARNQNKISHFENLLTGGNRLEIYVFIYTLESTPPIMKGNKFFYPGFCWFLFLVVLPIFSQAQSLYKTPSGQKYHLENCRTVKNVSELITPAQVKKLGLEPCKVCHPPYLSSVNNAAGNKANGQAQTVQCKGFTKKGARCKHMTRIGNGYCFQHDPGN
jgi:hypothetical protein